LRLITTSWDDGHPLDFRLAELLEKYGLKATFYIPLQNPEREVMKPEAVKELGKTFEIGGHTLNHVKLDGYDEWLFEAEIRGSFTWLHDLLGKEPVSFCFPLGAYNQASIQAVFRYGYKVARTTELLSLASFTRNMVSPTSLQVYEHSSSTYLKHMLKRRKLIRIMKWLTGNSWSSLPLLAERFVSQVIKHEGCFHLWGHSWEIEQYHLWRKLEEIFKIISNHPEISYVSNQGLVRNSTV
jgi:hypothetical protein